MAADTHRHRRLVRSPSPCQPKSCVHGTMRAPRFSNRAPYGKIEQTFANGLDGEPMITYVEADLFTSLAQTLVNTVNTAGVMGKGIAKRFKTVYHDMFRR